MIYILLSAIFLFSSGIYSSQTVTLNVSFPKAEVRQDIGSFSKDQKTLVGYAFLESSIQLQLEPLLSIQSQLAFEPIHNLRYYHDNYSNTVLFKDHGLYVKELYVNYGPHNRKVLVGKFSPQFGQAFSHSAGLWGNLGLPEAYELSEKLGVGGHVNTRWLRGTQPLSLTASVFKSDTSPLKHSWLVDRHSETKTAINDKVLESYALQATSRYRNLFDYYVGYRSIIHAKTDHETGYVFGIIGDSVVNGMAVTRLFEYTNIVNHTGLDAVASYWTYSVHGEKDRRLYSVAYTKFENTLTQASQLQISTGRRLRNNSVWDVGIQYTTGNQNDWYIGSRISIPLHRYTRSLTLKSAYKNDYAALVKNASDTKPTHSLSPNPSSIPSNSGIQSKKPTPFPGFY